jgi:hypothetical protein
MERFAALFTKFLGVIFAVIATVMLTVPHMNLASDGVVFESFTVAGKAEVRVS